MQFLHRVRAEFLLVSPRLLRTRLGLALLALGVTLVWLRRYGLDPLTVVLQAGALGAVVGSAGVVGHKSDRAALTTALTHPTTPLAVAAGRRLAVVLPAAAPPAGWGVWGAGPPGSAAAGGMAAAAPGGVALALVLPLGDGAPRSLFLFMSG